VLAEKGVPVGHKLAETLRAFPQIVAMPDVKRYFTQPDGTLYNQGDILKNPDFAATLRAIAKGGAKAFYAGRMRATLWTRCSMRLSIPAA